MADYERALAVVLEHEGGFVNNVHDPGGATKYGISLRFLKRIGIDIDHDGDLDEADVKVMTPAQASDFYFLFFWYPGGFWRLRDQALATKAFDMSVNLGPKQADILFYRALRLNQVAVDLRYPPIEQMNAADAPHLVADLCAVQTDFYVALAQAKPDLRRFLGGWTERAKWPFIGGSDDSEAAA